jgi:hypothetical protein
MKWKDEDRCFSGENVSNATEKFCTKELDIIWTHYVERDTRINVEKVEEGFIMILGLKLFTA